MSYSPTAIARTVGLWVLIVFDLAMLGWLYFTQNYIWLVVFTFITLWIVAAEIYGMLVGFRNESGNMEKMTISTAYKKYIQRVGWIGYIPLVMFWIAMTGLVLHLAVW